MTAKRVHGLTDLDDAAVCYWRDEQTGALQRPNRPAWARDVPAATTRIQNWPPRVAPRQCGRAAAAGSAPLCLESVHVNSSDDRARGAATPSPRHARSMQARTALGLLEPATAFIHSGLQWCAMNPREDSPIPAGCGSEKLPRA